MEPFLLNREEQLRKNRLAFSHLQSRFAAAHMGLRLFLAQQVHKTDEWQNPELLKTAASFSFAKGTFGKPKLKNSDHFAFNLSHSGDWAALATVEALNSATQPEVGIDLEMVSMRSVMDLAKRFFSFREWQSLYLCSDSAQRNRLFTKLWTRKEACLKLWGTGIHTSLRSFEVLSVLPTGLTPEPLPFPQCLHLQSAEVIEDMYLSLALSFIPSSISFTLQNWIDTPTTFNFALD